MAQPRVFTSVTELHSAVGEELGTSDWHEIDQKRIDLFADATGDHQWIHTDQERAAEGPFGSTVAHGYLTLALLPVLVPQVITVTGVRMGINYGTNKVRFPAPLPVGSRVRAAVTLADVSEVAGGVQLTFAVRVDREEGGKPACAAETVVRYLF